MREPPLLPVPGAPLLAVLARRMEVVYSELAGNALRHARQPVRVTLSSSPDSWLIGVEDSAPELEPAEGGLEPEQIGGRGLAIVLTLASAAGWYVRDATKTVWAEIPDTPSEHLIELLSLRRPGLARG
ncbi:ATP-binding protein [Kineosporia sp. J2-2]|uniref:ATP-binding protein n=1 Tax=Kineosporia corallincola TaxID=2835133 RepID=A0ABS5TDW2_9ACTN|nr:ATP-binding protein [Kineosporia corallincola]MBT0767814.1 ATP-binding protein [Kineosporia corallincola]